MTKEERDRVLMQINLHIENGKQLIRDKRILIEILEKEVGRLTSMFNMPWKSAANEKRLEAVYCELDRADHDINVQRNKNTKLRNLRMEVHYEELNSPEPVLLLTEAVTEPLPDDAYTPFQEAEMA